MKKFVQKQLLIAMLSFAAMTGASAQNWQYVGTPYINQTTGITTYLYFGDMEMNAAGDIFIAYWEYSGVLHFAEYSAGTWTQLPSPGTFPVSNVDIEVKDNNYYIAYSGVRGANSYAFVRKYDGTSWNQLGDSMLLGNSGSGGWFEFALDNNEVPTVLGVVSAPFADKQVMQYTGGSWTSVITLTSSAATIFREHSAIFDDQNKLLCVTQSFVTTPSVQYFNIVSKVDAGVATTLGDTLTGQAANCRLNLDANHVPYLTYNSPIISKCMAYKLDGSTWTFIADTTGNAGSMLCADVTGDGKVVFNTLQTDVDRSVYYYENNTRTNMDSINVNGFAVGSVQDIVIPAGSNDAYVLILEIKPSAAQDFSVMKHAVSGTPNAVTPLASVDDQVFAYPNPSTGRFTLRMGTETAGVKVLSLTGAVVYEAQAVRNGQVIDLEGQPAGLYFLQINDGTRLRTQKIMIR